MHDLEHELQNRPRSNVNMPIERLHATFCLGNSNICPMWHGSRDINSRNVHDLDPDPYNGLRSNVNMSIERLHATFCMLAIVLSVTVCKIITFELCRCTRFETLTLKMKDVDDLDENKPSKVPCRHTYVHKKMAPLGPAVSFREGRTHGHTDERTYHLPTNTVPTPQGTV